MRCFLLSFLFLLAVLTPAHAEDMGQRVIAKGILRCGYEAWPPYFEKTIKTGKLSGLSKDMVDEMMATVGVKIDYV